jgi:hypothetical protein
VVAEAKVPRWFPPVSLYRSGERLQLRPRPLLLLRFRQLLKLPSNGWSP